MLNLKNILLKLLIMLANKLMAALQKTRINQVVILDWVIIKIEEIS